MKPGLFPRLCIAIAVASGAQAADLDNLRGGHPTGHVHDHGDQTWPPQPRGLSDSTVIGDAVAERTTAQTRRARVDTRARWALARSDVRAALGRRYCRPALIEAQEKSAGTDDRLYYFSYSNNQTIEVSVAPDRVRSMRRIPASQYQPDITDDETAAAEAIARPYFAALGKPRVAALKAYGILAHRPEGTGFYDTRVIYLSFHAYDDAPPEYMAWVDLTNNRVLRSREEPR